MKRILTGFTVALLSLSSSAFAADAPAAGGKDYIIAASRYLNVQKEGSIRVNKVISGLKAEETTGAYFRKTVQEAMTETNDDWVNNYVKSVAENIPASYTEIDKNIQQSHDLRQAAFDSWLNSPADQDPVSLVSANESFKSSLELEEKALDDIIDILKAGTSMQM